MHYITIYSHFDSTSLVSKESNDCSSWIPNFIHLLYKILNKTEEIPVYKLECAFIYNNNIYSSIQVDDEEGEDDNDVEELLDKLKDATELFEAKNDVYLQFQKKSEEMKKVRSTIIHYS